MCIRDRVSCVPWVSFTSVGHDTPGPRQMYFPIIVFGRYHEVHDRWMLPFSIMVNHAVADGYHTSMPVSYTHLRTFTETAGENNIFFNTEACCQIGNPVGNGVNDTGRDIFTFLTGADVADNF